MINLKCTHKHESEKSFEILFHKNILSFGSSRINDIVIVQDKIPSLALTLEVSIDKIFLSPSIHFDVFIHNSSKTTHIKRVFLRDTFVIGNFTFELLEAQFQKKMSINKIINEQTEKILKEPLLAKRIKEIHERV